eukprot:gene7845-9659_t
MDSVDSANDFIELRNSREEIQTIIFQFRLYFTILKKAYDEITIAKAQLEGFELNKLIFKDYTQKKSYEEITIVDAPYHSTICRMCDYVCHDNCPLDEIRDIGNSKFKDCPALGPFNTCTQCPRKCSYLYHYHARKKMIKTQKTFEVVIDGIKDQYDAAIKGINETKLKINTAEETYKSTKLLIKQNTDSFAQQCKKIKSICSGFDFIDELNCLKILESEHSYE